MSKSQQSVLVWVGAGEARDFNHKAYHHSYLVEARLEAIRELIAKFNDEESVSVVRSFVSLKSGDEVFYHRNPPEISTLNKHIDFEGDHSNIEIVGEEYCSTTSLNDLIDELEMVHGFKNHLLLELPDQNLNLLNGLSEANIKNFETISLLIDSKHVSNLTSMCSRLEKLLLELNYGYCIVPASQAGMNFCIFYRAQEGQAVVSDKSQDVHNESSENNDDVSIELEKLAHENSQLREHLIRSNKFNNRLRVENSDIQQTNEKLEKKQQQINDEMKKCHIQIDLLKDLIQLEDGGNA